MSDSWPLQKAKNEFSRLVERALSEGPQTVTRHGKPVVVISAIEGAPGRARDVAASKALLSLLRSCPTDLTRILVRDKSEARSIDLG